VQATEFEGLLLRTTAYKRVSELIQGAKRFIVYTISEKFKHCLLKVDGLTMGFELFKYFNHYLKRLIAYWIVKKCKTLGDVRSKYLALR
jgi:hypothetical protein